MLFSSGGAYTWAEMIDLIAPGGEFALIGERLAGVIFDSAPCHFSIAHAVNASTGAIQNITLTTFQEFILKIAVTFSVMLHYFVNLLLFRSLMNTDGEEFWRRMQSAPPDANFTCLARRTGSQIPKSWQNSSGIAWILGPTFNT